MSRFRDVERIIEAELEKPYAYGVSDCFFLGLAIIDGLTGSNLRKAYGKAYRTLPGAQKALRRRGHSSIVGLFEEHLPRIGPAEAALGDIVVLRLNGHEHVGVCLGGQFVTKTEKGRAFHGLADVVAAFRVS